jgi:hypothetical protein
MADAKKGAEEEGGEFADFLADVSQEIAQRVESLDPTPKAKPEAKKAAPEAKKGTPEAKKGAPEAKKGTPEAKKGTPVPHDAGLILEWENVVDRMIEDMR